jgi:ferredoxin-NADP reductase
VAGTAVSGRLIWRVATIKEVKDETATARTLSLDVPGWPGHLAGQHVTVRLTAADGYSAHRDYSIASAPEADRLELTVQRLGDGEVSPYLSGFAQAGDQFEVRGPIGGWFAWSPDDPRPLFLLAGGSGVVPLMSMVRAHGQAKSQAPVRLIYSARTPADVIYAQELASRSRLSPLTVTYLYTRSAPPGTTPAHAATGLFHGVAGLFHGAAGKPDAPAPRAAEPAPRDPAAAPLTTAGTDTVANATVANATVAYSGRLSADVLFAQGFPAKAAPAIFACGPNGFVDAASTLLENAGYPPGAIRTERFGASS